MKLKSSNVLTVLIFIINLSLSSCHFSQSHTMANSSNESILSYMVLSNNLINITNTHKKAFGAIEHFLSPSDILELDRAYDVVFSDEKDISLLNLLNEY